jgi:hypothetical protein
MEAEPNIEKTELNDLDKLRLDYTWKWFDFHAKQRMQLFNFFLIITGILATAFVSAYDKSLYFLAVAVCVIGSLQSLGFLAFDFRSRTLTRYAEDILEKIEGDTLFHNYSTAGHPVGLVNRDKLSNDGGFINYLLKMKVAIRIVELVVFAAFVMGIVDATRHLWR